MHESVKSHRTHREFGLGASRASLSFVGTWGHRRQRAVRLLAGFRISHMWWPRLARQHHRVKSAMSIMVREEKEAGRDMNRQFKQKGECSHVGFLGSARRL